MNEISSLIRRNPETSLHHSAKWGYKKSAVCNLEKCPPSIMLTPWSQTSSLRYCEKFLLFFSYPWSRKFSKNSQPKHSNVPMSYKSKDNWNLLTLRKSQEAKVFAGQLHRVINESPLQLIIYSPGPYCTFFAQNYHGMPKETPMLLSQPSSLVILKLNCKQTLKFTSFLAYYLTIWDPFFLSVNKGK